MNQPWILELSEAGAEMNSEKHFQDLRNKVWSDSGLWQGPFHWAMRCWMFLFVIKIVDAKGKMYLDNWGIIKVNKSPFWIELTSEHN